MQEKSDKITNVILCEAYVRSHFTAYAGIWHKYACADDFFGIGREKSMAEVFSTIRDILVSADERFGDGDAVRYKKSKDEIEAKSYHDLRTDSENFSHMLADIGQQGAHVALMGTTSYAWLVTYFGVVNSGGVAVPLDASLPAEEICDLINRADVTTFVFDETCKQAAELSVEKCPGLQYRISMKAEADEGAFSSMQSLMAAHPGACDITPAPEDVCTIMYTSGTTGKSKGVILTHRNLAENATVLDMHIQPRTVILSVLPIHHAYCLSMDILKAISLGGIICINDSLLRVARNIKLFEPDMILMVPLMIETMAKKLEDAPKLPAAIIKRQVFGKNLHTICSGGAYLNPARIDMMEKYGIQILQGYGMTECSPVISNNVSWDNRRGSVGKLLPNCEAKVVDEELWVRGSSVMQGYYHMPEETAETLCDGWLKTGDLGYVDEDGYVYLTGRKKNLIITPNGENVSPEELENKLAENRLVAEVLVRETEGMIEAEIFPDAEYARKKKIDDVQAALQAVLDDFNETVPAYKKIYRLKVRDTEFDKTTSRKIKRF